ncbi:MAG TPA: hypothetical protein VIL69_17175 [Roseomonas sp.]
MSLDNYDDASSDTVMLTYQELAERLGIDVQSARRRAQRSGWRRIPGNDGKARVVVPGHVLATDSTAAAPKTPSSATSAPPDPMTLEMMSHLLSQLEETRTLAAQRGIELARERERLARVEGERDGLRDGFRLLEARAEEAEERARTAEEKAAEVRAVMSRVAAGLEQIQKAQIAATEELAAGRTERMEARAAAEQAALRASEAEAQAKEASRRAAVAEASLDDLQSRRTLESDEVAASQTERDAALSRAAEAEKLAAEAREKVDEAEARAKSASERLSRLQQERIVQAQDEAAARAAAAAKLAAEAQRSVWQRLFGRRRRS